MCICVCVCMCSLLLCVAVQTERGRDRFVVDRSLEATFFAVGFSKEAGWFL